MYFRNVTFFGRVFWFLENLLNDGGGGVHVVAQLVEVLRYEPERSPVRFPMVSLEFFIDVFFSGRSMALGSIQPLTEMSIRRISWGLKAQVCRADNFTTFMCRLS